MEIYRDMLEKLKYHKQLIMNAFIRNNYYPSNEEVNAALKSVNARMSLFETYISKPGDYFNPTEINYCFEMLCKDIEILYKVLEAILTNEFANLKMHIEATLTELEARADYFYKRCLEETNSSSFGTTLMFQANNWNVTTEDQITIVDLGDYEFVEGTDIACYANINDINDNNARNETVSFKFTAEDTSNNFLALPYNLYEKVYTIPGEPGVNTYETIIGSYSIVNNNIRLDCEINPVNKYKVVSGKNFISVTYKRTGRTELVEFPDMSNYNFLAVDDCYVEFFIVDGNVNENSLLEYSFNMVPTHQNFSLQDGFIKIDKDIKRIYIDAQMGLLMSFRMSNGTPYAESLDPIILDSHTILYNGNLKVKDITIREYVRTDIIKYNIKLYIDSITDVIDKIESIYIKELN